MSKNAAKIIMLLAPVAFLLSSCSAFRSVDSTAGGRGQSSKSPSSTTDLRTQVASYAKELRGVKYKYAGQSPRSGFDCSGFTSYVLQRFKVSIPRSSSAQASAGKKISLSKSRPGDLVFFSKRGRGKVSHVAIVVENRRRDGLIVAHSTSSRGVIIENVSSSSYWKPKMLFARDVIGNR
ncbi:MAG: C40 family peptidase [Bacteroidota bacterium]